MAETITHRRERSIKDLFVGECWEYLRNNFHKFNETNKIKIALELCKKDIPQEMTGSFNVTQMPAIQKSSGEANNTNRIAEYFIGLPSSSQDT